MSTRQYQAFEDANTAFEKAKEALRHARKEFIAHIRVTGTALRKAFIPDSDRGALGSIATHCTDWINGEEIPLTAMEVVVRSFAGNAVTDLDCDRVKDWLLRNGWTVKNSNRYNVECHVFVCI